MTDLIEQVKLMVAQFEKIEARNEELEQFLDLIADSYDWQRLSKLLPGEGLLGIDSRARRLVAEREENVDDQLHLS